MGSPSLLTEPRPCGKLPAHRKHGTFARGYPVAAPGAEGAMHSATCSKCWAQLVDARFWRGRGGGGDIPGSTPSTTGEGACPQPGGAGRPLPGQPQPALHPASLLGWKPRLWSARSFEVGRELPGSLSWRGGLCQEPERVWTCPPPSQPVLSRALAEPSLESAELSERPKQARCTDGTTEGPMPGPGKPLTQASAQGGGRTCAQAGAGAPPHPGALWPPWPTTESSPGPAHRS